MGTITEEIIRKTHDYLIDFSYNNLAGGRQQEGLNLCQDVTDYCLGGKWPNLAPLYKRAWLGEIIRRIKLIIPLGTTVIAIQPTRDPSKRPVQMTQQVLLQGLNSDPAIQPLDIQQIYFSQFSVNRHFQGNYVGQPIWLAEKEILEVAKTLRASPEKSADLRIRLYHHANQWIALNNRGFALHCLANVAPRRLAFDTDLSSDEQSRLNKSLDQMGLNFKEAIPSGRRNPKHWESQIPTSVTAIPETKNSPDVVYTVKAIAMDVSKGPDGGNETVYNS